MVLAIKYLRFFIVGVVFATAAPSLALKIDKRFNFASALSEEDWQKENSPYRFDWQLASTVKNFQRVTDDSLIFQTNLALVSQIRFLKELKFYGDFRTSLQTGRAQSRYGDLSPESGVFIDDAYFTWSPLEEIFDFEVGALGQDRTVGSDILVKGSAFPGLSQKLGWSLKDEFSFKLRFQQLVPYSQTQEAELREKEALPFFHTEGVEAKIEKDFFNFKISGGLFEFKNLPSQVAERSRLFGNSVTGNDLNAEFDYNFKGWFLNSDVDILVGKMLLLLEANLVENLEAPIAYSRAQKFTGTVKYSDKNYEFGPLGSVFSIEPDASPAFYNSNYMGNTNREGYSVGLVYLQKKNFPFAFSFEYIDARLLNENLNFFQQDQTIFLLNFQTRFKRMGS